MNLRERRILNHAAEWAQEEGPQYRDAMVEELESRRRDLGISNSQVDTFLGKPDNWYSNRVQREGSHKFSIIDVELIRVLLNKISEAEDVELSEIEAESREYARSRMGSLDSMRQSLGLSEDRIESALNHYRGWWEEVMDGDLKVVDYHEIEIFLESVAVLYSSEGILSEEEESDLRDTGHLVA